MFFKNGAWGACLHCVCVALQCNIAVIWGFFQTQFSCILWLSYAFHQYFVVFSGQLFFFLLSVLLTSLIPRPFEEGEEKGPGTHRLRMRQFFRKNVRKSLRTLTPTMCWCAAYVYRIRNDLLTFALALVLNAHLLWLESRQSFIDRYGEVPWGSSKSRSKLEPF